jgi:hypothetical protein
MTWLIKAIFNLNIGKLMIRVDAMLPSLGSTIENRIEFAEGMC